MYLYKHMNPSKLFHYILNACALLFSRFKKQMEKRQVRPRRHLLEHKLIKLRKVEGYSPASFTGAPAKHGPRKLLQVAGDRPGFA